MWNRLLGVFDSRFTWANLIRCRPFSDVGTREKSHPTEVSIGQPWSSLEWWCKWNGILNLIHFPPSSHVCWLGYCIMLLVPIWWNAPVPTWDFLSLLLGFQKLNVIADISKNRLTCRNMWYVMFDDGKSQNIISWTDAFWSNWLKQIYDVVDAFPHRGIVICFCFKMLKAPKMRSEVESSWCWPHAYKAQWQILASLRIWCVQTTQNIMLAPVGNQFQPLFASVHPSHRQSMLCWRFSRSPSPIIPRVLLWPVALSLLCVLLLPSSWLISMWWFRPRPCH